MAEASESSPNVPAPVDDSTTSRPSPDNAWQDQLALARESLKQRVEQQQAEDGSVENPHIPSPPPPVDHAPDDQAGRQSGDAAHTIADRRGSTTSNGTAEEDHDEDEEDFVHHHLTGLRRRRPAQGASGSGADEAAEGAQEAPRAADGAAEEQDRVCRICFGGSEEEEEMGKLFSPCICRGTVSSFVRPCSRFCELTDYLEQSRHVHVKCLDQWRQASANSCTSTSSRGCLGLRAADGRLIPTSFVLRLRPVWM
jgi:hypothetical protein